MEQAGSSSFCMSPSNATTTRPPTASPKGSALIPASIESNEPIKEKANENSQLQNQATYQDVKNLEDKLSAWQQDPNVIGEKAEMAQRIVDAYKHGHVELDLSELSCSEVPAEIGQLKHLTTLILANNQLRSLPPEIGNLNALQALILESNQLKALPDSISNCSQLTFLAIHGNEQLSELPASMGKLLGITFLNTANTKISDAQRDSILSATEAGRAKASLTNLQSKIQAWQAHAEARHVIDETTLSDSHKTSVYEWLCRLECTDDFMAFKKELTGTACRMLEDVTSGRHPEFKESFFNILEPNLADCEDRTAMTFNLLSTSWKLDCVLHEGDLASKLDTIEKIVRTNLFRTELDNQMSNAEQAGKLDLSESTEIYLYYENLLKDELNLDSAFEVMAYGDDIEEKHNDWLDIDKLKATVNRDYLTKMASLPQIDKLWTNATADATPEALEKLNDEMMTLMENQAGTTESQYLARADELKTLYDQTKLEVITQWIKDTLPAQETKHN